MVTGRFRIVILFLQFLLIVGVIAVPHRGHGAQHSALFQRHHTDVADGLRRNDTCPTPQGPTEWWLDYSVKNKHGDESVTCPALTWAPARNLAKREDFTCDESNPCSNGACCGTSGYCGYGETYCGNGITPNDNCWSNCDAHAECGKDALKVNATCPLNVCCSQYGFCGVTEDFCTVVRCLFQSSNVIPFIDGIICRDAKATASSLTRAPVAVMLNRELLHTGSRGILDQHVLRAMWA